MTRKRLTHYRVFLIYGAALALCIFALTGCSMFGTNPVEDAAARLSDTIDEAAQDGAFDATDFKLICRDAAWLDVAFEEQSKPWSPPATGVPWLDMALGAAGLAASIAGSVKATNIVRDRQRKKRGEPVGKVA